jgi:polyhydroxyalkanoate synthesis regulator phasin
MIRILRILNAPLGQTPNLLPGRSLGLVAGAAALVVGSFAQTSFSAQDSDVQKDPVVAESSSLDGAESISQETYEKLTKAVKEKVKAGEMTPEKAHEIEVRLRERLSSSERPPSPTAEEVKKAADKLDKLVAAGEITRAAADRRIGRMKLALEKASARETSSISGEEFRKSSIEIKLLVRSGNLTQEEAAAKILALSKLVRTEGGEESQGEKGKESSRKRGND